MRRILDDIAKGVPKCSAFATNGICEKTGYNWANNDPIFSKLLEGAEHRFKSNIIKATYEAATEPFPKTGDWKAGTTLLKMRHPEFRDKGIEVNVKAEATVSNIAVSPSDLATIQRLNRETIMGGAN